MSKTDFFKIDPNALDREWLRQPDLYHEHALQLAEARHELEQQKAGIDVVRAEIDKKIRRKPERYSRVKLTETMISSIIDASVEYQGAVSELHEARHRVDILQVAVDTLDQRKKALENLVQLRLADYYSEPRIKGNPKTDELQKRRARTAGREDRDG